MSDYFLDKSNDGPEGETNYSYDPASHARKKWTIPMRTKITLGLIAVGGMAVGTLLFLFFITAFIYLFIPVVIVLTLYRLFSHRP